MDESLMTAPELARQLGLDPKYLRHLIREHNLVPDHQHGKRYELDQDDIARIAGHAAVRRAVAP
jgi:predicted site-specific integrase-resolvase